MPRTIGINRGEEANDIGAEYRGELATLSAISFSILDTFTTASFTGVLSSCTCDDIGWLSDTFCESDSSYKINNGTAHLHVKYIILQTHKI